LKRIALFVAILVVLGTATAWTEGDFGLGIVLGQPTGISAKYWLSVRSSIDGAAAWSFVHKGSLYLHVDYQYYVFDLASVQSGRLGFFLGLGGRLLFADDFNLGLRVPLGLIYLFSDLPLDVFLEVVPIMELLPATAASGGAAIGLRYYF
jgi:hypothetical protein